MKFSVCLPCFFRDTPFPEAVRRARACGFDAVELWHFGHPDLAEAKAALDDNGVTLVGMCTGVFTLTDPAARPRYLESLKESAEKAAYLGASRLITQVGADTGADRAAQHESIVEGLRAAHDILAPYRVTLSIEPLNVLFDHPGYYLTSSEEAFAIVREAASPYVKVLYDIYHQQISEGNIIPTVKAHVADIAHFHAAGHPGRHELQQGELDFRNVFAAIDGAGYAGYTGLEYHPTLPPEESLAAFRNAYLC